MIQLLKPVQLEEYERLVVLRISKKSTYAETTSATSKDWRKFVGLIKDKEYTRTIEVIKLIED
ncbi:MAG: hypothetical protein NTY69_10470 [Methylococcales bacterium]|nr:hypothetical protein [Methylococcales bacterium]